MDFIQITNDPDFAAFAVSCGVSRIMVDLEQHGKQERQGGLGTFISNHVPQDVAIVRQAVPQAALIVRINPLHDASALEIDQALTGGASDFMLPMFRSADTVARFVALAPTTTLPPRCFSGLPLFVLNSTCRSSFHKSRLSGDYPRKFSFSSKHDL